MRRSAPEFDAAALLPILQGLRDRWLQPFSGLPNGELLDTLATAIPERPPSLAAKLAAWMPDEALTATLTESPLASAIDLLELLVFLGRSIPLDTAAALTGRARTAGELALMARAVAAFAQSTPTALPQLDRLAGSLESRLDAIAESRRDILSWEASGSGARIAAGIENGPINVLRLFDAVQRRQARTQPGLAFDPLSETWRTVHDRIRNQYMRAVLQSAEGNKDLAAKRAGLSRSQFYELLKHVMQAELKEPDEP